MFEKLSLVGLINFKTGFQQTANFCFRYVCQESIHALVWSETKLCVCLVNNLVKYELEFDAMY